MTDTSWVYRQNPEVAIEDFGERSLALHCTELRLVELNTTARELVARLDGQSSLGQIAQAIAAEYHHTPAAVLADVLAAVSRMAELGVVARIVPEPTETAPSPTAERL